MRRTLHRLRGLKPTRGSAQQYDDGSQSRFDDLWDLFKTVATHTCGDKKVESLRYTMMHYVGYICRGCSTEWMIGRNRVADSDHPWRQQLIDHPHTLADTLNRGVYFKEVEQ